MFETLRTKKLSFFKIFELNICDVVKPQDMMITFLLMSDYSCFMRASIDGQLDPPLSLSQPPSSMTALPLSPSLFKSLGDEYSPLMLLIRLHPSSKCI